MYDRVNLIVCHCLMARQRELLAVYLLGYGQRQVCKLWVAVLPVGWNGVVNHCFHALLLQVLLQFVAPFGKYGKYVVDIVAAAVASYPYVIVADFRLVSARNFLSAAVVIGKIFQLNAQQRRLYLVYAAVSATMVENVFACRAVVAERTDSVCQLVVVGGNGTRIAHSAEIFARIETVSGSIAYAARAPQCCCF